MEKSVFICPVCRENLERDDKIYRCGKGHSFDISAKGYVNLLTSSAKHSPDPGDNKLMVNARANFLGKGYYSHLAEAVCDTVLKYYSGGVILDSGCGEGYYTEKICAAVGEKFGGELSVKDCKCAALDISKYACAKTARRLKSLPIQTETTAASVFSLPVKDGSVSLLITMFAPLCREEFARVIKPGGGLIMAIPGKEHLMSFKEKIYDRAYENETADYGLEGFELTEVKKISREIFLDDSEDIKNLFAMTPYYYKTGKEGHERVNSMTELETKAEFEIIAYKRDC
ncbi:MAG: methyltransferase domain-containing protein [Ruminococcus sp.]|nr:methyltransferase domain-containing protein [Ruminococcus sp.]